jgi:DNA-binding MarR family transcriptional regulator
MAMTTETSVMDPDRALCFALYSATHAVLGEYRSLLEPLGLTYQQYLVLEVLRGHGPSTVGELAGALCVDPATASGLIRRMEREDLVVKRRDGVDQRVVRVDRTARARELAPALDEIPACLAGAVGLPAADVQDLVERLHGLRTTLTGSAASAAGSTKGQHS